MMRNGFWTGGAGAYERGLHAFYEARLASLRAQMSTSSEANITKELKEQIRYLEQEYRNKLSDVKELLF